MTPHQIKKIKQVIDSGGVIAYPTESVYGLGCNPNDYHAVKRLLNIKQRPLHKGLILVAASVAQLEDWIEKPSSEIWSHVKKSWPGPHNWVLPANSLTPMWITGGRLDIVVRVSDHYIIKEICVALGHPIVSTSANLSGRTPQTTALGVGKQLGACLDYIVAGDAGGLNPCPITHALKNTKIRD